jgi:hypothetical protein
MIALLCFKPEGRMDRASDYRGIPWNDLIHDRDRVYGTMVTRRLRAMGEKHTAAASPWQNGFAER